MSQDDVIAVSGRVICDRAMYEDVRQLQARTTDHTVGQEPRSYDPVAVRLGRK